MTPNSQAAIIENDLRSLVHRIEALPAHPEYTAALIAVKKAREAINAGRSALRAEAMASRFAPVS